MNSNFPLNNFCLDAIRKMNEYGAMRVPFLFIVDFEMNKPIVLSTDEISGNNIRFAIGEKEVEPIQKKIHFKT
ncbi:MAG: hypothetical protein C4517_09945, partial [Stygiobacter sp.]